MDTVTYRDLNATNEALNNLNSRVGEMLWLLKGHGDDPGLSEKIDRIEHAQARMEAQQKAHNLVLVISVISMWLAVALLGLMTILAFLFVVWDRLPL